MDILQYTHALVIIKADFLYSLTIGLYVGVRSSRYEARGKFGEHVRVARGVAESNSSFLSCFPLLVSLFLFPSNN